MLKFTNSFYRCLTITCKVDCEANVKKYSNLSSLRYILCQANSDDLKLKRQYNNSKISQKYNKLKRQSPITKPVKMEDDKDNNIGKLRRIESLETLVLEILSDQDMSDLSEDERDRPAYNTRHGCRNIRPELRRWKPVHKPSKDDNVIRFRVVSYNVLAQCLLESHSELYSDCALNNLKWKTRSARLYEEITALNPDVICFQEVQESHLNGFFAKFKKIGYEGVYKQKTGNKQDGCAIYFKKSVFTLKEEQSVEFMQPSLKLLDRDNIGLMVKLTPVSDPETQLVVATTHLLYNPRRTDVRLAQLQLFLAEIDRFAFYNHGEKSGHLPIILTGDFNSKPNSEVITLLNEGHILAKSVRDNSDWENIGVTDNCQHLSVYINRRYGFDTDYGELQIHHSQYKTESPPAPVTIEEKKSGVYSLMFNSNELFQTLNLFSVYYKAFRDSDSEVTTFQDGWVTVDYIFYSKLVVTHRLELPSASECKEFKHLPNEKLGSDHLLLAAVFELTPRRDYSV